MPETTYTVQLRKDNDFCVVGIHVKTRFKNQPLRTFIKSQAIDKDLAQKGLVPIEPARGQIPELFLS